jgi:hypothetical protein
MIHAVSSYSTSFCYQIISLSSLRRRSRSTLEQTQAKWVTPPGGQFQVNLASRRQLRLFSLAYFLALSKVRVM